MLIQILLALTLGILAGTLTGIIPGIHINLVAALLLSLSIYFLQFAPLTTLIIFIVAMSITHTFIDFIPSIFLGAPDSDTVLSVLPGHELLKKGRAYEAVFYTTYGSLSAIIIILFFIPPLFFILPSIEPIIITYKLIPIILILSSMFLISREKEKLNALIVFTLSGFLGIAVLNSNVNQPFLPMLSGLFGASSLILSIKTKTKIPKQKIFKPYLNKKQSLKPILASAFASPLCCLLPAIGSGQAAIIGTSLIKPTRQNFLILLGATNTIVVGLSFIIYYIIGKTRTGVAVSLQNLIENINLNHILIIITTIILTGIICYFYTLQIAKFFALNINKINYTKLSIITLIFISLIVLIFSKPFGFFIFIISTATGLFGILTGARRINLMGCLVVPVVLSYLL